MTTTDAVVIGSGPNGLVAANLLVDAGWSVVVLEEQERPGGAVLLGDVGQKEPRLYRRVKRVGVQARLWVGRRLAKM